MWQDVESEVSAHLGIYWQHLDVSEQQAILAYASSTKVNKRDCLSDLKTYAKQRLTRRIREALLTRLHNHYGETWDALPYPYRHGKLEELVRIILVGDRFKFKAELYWIKVHIEGYEPRKNKRRKPK